MDICHCHDVTKAPHHKLLIFVMAGGQTELDTQISVLHHSATLLLFRILSETTTSTQYYNS
jgi:hypothetical protein